MTDTSPAPSAIDLGLDVQPMAGHIGAEIHGADLSRPLEPDVVAAIRQEWLRWKVVFFRDQEITQAQHIAFGEQFGEVLPGHPTLPAAFPDYPAILLLDNRQIASGGIHRSDGDAADDGGRGDREGAPAESPSVESRWHTDVTFTLRPPMASILRGVVVPPYGGDTQWTNLVVAYEQLSDPIKEMIDGLHAVHHNTLPIERGELPSGFAKMFMGDGIRSVHPVVRVHPETGEKALFVNPNFTSHIVELTRKEGSYLLALLYEHLANPRYTVRFRWQPNSIAFWDNRATAHLVPTDVPPGAHRSMQRITLAGDVPVGPDGSRSYALQGPDAGT